MAKAPENMPLVDKEAQKPEEKEPEEKEETLDNFALKNTTTDCAILACSRLGHSDKMPVRDTLGFVSTFLLHIATQGIQLLLLWLMFSGPVEGYEDPYETAQFAQTSFALKNATAGKQILGVFPANSPLQQALAKYTHLHCKANTSALGVHLIFLVLWFGISWDAISTTCHRFVVLHKLPREDLSDTQDFNTKEGIDLTSAPKEGNHDITHMKLPWKIFVGLFILLPHLFTVLCLVWTGTKMQAFAPSILIQAKASLKLGVIVTLSASIMTWFGSGHLHKYMAVDPENKATPVGVYYRIVKTEPTGLAKMMAGKVWLTWGETVFKLVVGSIFCFFIVFYWYEKFHAFNGLCRDYFEMVGCSAPQGTAGLSLEQKAICPQRPVQDWFSGN